MVTRYEQQVLPNSIGLQPRASADGAVGAALQNLGAAGQQLADSIDRREQRKQLEIKRKEDEDARAWTSSALSESHVKWAQRISELQQNAPEGAPNFAKDFLTEFDTYKADAIKNAPNDAARKFYGERLDAMRSNLFSDAVGFEARKNVEWKLNQGKIASANVADTATTDPERAKTMLAEQEAIFGGYENKQVGAALITGMREQASAYAVNGMIAREPGKALELLDTRLKNNKSGDLWVDMLDGQKLVQFRHQAMTEMQRLGAENRFDINSRTKDVQAMVVNGVEPPANVVPSREDYAKAYGPNGPAMWQQEVGNYLEIGGSLRLMKTASFDERRKLIDDAKPEAGAGFAGRMQSRDIVARAGQIVDQQIVSDPAAYAIQNSPRVQQAANVMERVLRDPKQSAEDKAAVTDFFVRTTMAEQLRLGVDQIRDDRTGNRIRGPKILTNQQANAIADRFASQDEGGVNAANTVLSLEQQYGKYWPQVYGQLATDNKLPPAALVIPNMPNDASRARLAQVSAMKPEDLKALVSASDPKDIRERVQSEFDQAQRTFTAQGVDGNRTLSVVMEQAEKLATLYRSQGKSVKDAAKQAFTETMGHKYQFADTYRVPIDKNIREVNAGAQAVLQGVIKAGDATVFSGDAPVVMTTDALQNRSMWINTPDESGIQLMIRGSDGGVYGVRGKDGKPIQVDWNTLVTNARSAKAVDDSQEGQVEWMRRRQQELNPRR